MARTTASPLVGRALLAAAGAGLAGALAGPAGARPYGVPGTRVSTVDGLSKALEQAVQADRVQLIEVEIPNGFGALV